MRDKSKQMVLVRNYRIGKIRDMGAADLGRTTHLAVMKAAAQPVEEEHLKRQEAENWGKTQ